MGIVFRAFHHRMNRSVALTMLSPDVAADAEFRRRFTREAAALA